MTRNEMREAICNLAILYCETDTDADTRESFARENKDKASGAGERRHQAEKFRQEMKGMVRDYMGLPPRLVVLQGSDFMKGTISLETYDTLCKAFTDRETVPMIDYKTADQGCLNIVVGVCPPGLWGHNIILQVEAQHE